MTCSSLQTLLGGLPATRILVLGDFFLDKYLLIDRDKDEISVETGLVAYQVVGKRLNPGAAGAVVSNLCALGVGQVKTLGVIGNDGEAEELLRTLHGVGADTSELIRDPRRMTPTYMKPFVCSQGGGEELNRLDIKNWSPLPHDLEQRITARLHELASEVDAIIVIDQVVQANTGLVTESMRGTLAKLGARKPTLPIIVDSRAFAGSFRHVIIKCNQFEAVPAAFPGEHTVDFEAARAAALRLSRRTKRPVFVTCGEDGIIVAGAEGVAKVPAVKVTGPLDTVGAGDATTAGIACALAHGWNLVDAARLGSIIASITIQQVGTTGTATPKQVLQRYAEVQHTP